MKAPVSTGTNFEPAPEGNQTGILIGMYHLGPQEHTFQGETKMRSEIRFTFELPDNKRKFGEDEEEKPYVVGKSGSFSMHEKAFLRKTVEACEGKKLKDHEAEAFEIENVLGKACLVNISHWERDGKKGAFIESVSPLPRGMKAPKPENPTVKFNVMDYTLDEFNELPDWMQEKVKSTKFRSKEEKAMDGDDSTDNEEKGIDPGDIPF